MDFIGSVFANPVILAVFADDSGSQLKVIGECLDTAFKLVIKFFEDLYFIMAAEKVNLS